ncbi:MAG: hypothetical protein K8F54_09215 [Altibacter sp.]|uniref:hypothetical protein n=1 Tax=Altibacter sp. TaxID=2024823 RepID=UPI001D510C2A|nr:hypothetical protein [Altibacter sp.]MBZ0327769.1 hypothetical protein [Altibacter sp.]
MKKVKILSVFFLLIAFYLASGVSVFANTEVLSQTTSEEKHLFQTDSHAAALFVEEMAPSEVFQPASESNSFFNSIGIGTAEISFSNQKRATSYQALLVRDQRKLISQYLFPFHFFW